jgi:transcriptional regulator with XRE-family HTH domain
MDIVSDVIDRLKEAMQEKGINQTDLAKQLGCTKAHVSQLLSKKSGNFTLRTIERVAKAIGYELVVTLQPFYNDDEAKDEKEEDQEDPEECQDAAFR